MSAKKLTIELLDAQGQPVSGTLVSASGCGELRTSVMGTVMFLVDEPQVVVKVDGQEVYNGTLDALPAQMRLTQQAGGWKA